MPPDERTALLLLAELWQKEKLATREQERGLRDTTPFAERVRRGLALEGLRYENTESIGAGRCSLWFILQTEGELEEAQVNVGDPVVLWATGHKQRQLGVVGRRGQTRLSVIVDSDYSAFVETGVVCLDREPSEVTFERGEAAIQRFLTDDALAMQRSLFFGKREPEFEAHPELTFRDEGLNQSQQEAVRFALSAQQVALIHGPPGTGKTRTLVEVIRQHVLAGRSVLVTAASNTAVDHLTRQLIEQGAKPVRLGHPARVAADLRRRTAEALMEATEEYALAQKWQAEARAIREKQNKRKAGKARTNAKASRDELARANQLNADARHALKNARAKVLRRSKIICTTAAGADASVLAGLNFDVVVLDEATQAVDPVALAALMRAERSVLAGDPNQLSPTVVDPEALRLGLGTTLFERATERWPPSATHLLEVQYRMHAALMRFPSLSMYGGRLIAHESAATRTLLDLPGVGPDTRRGGGPWLLVDTAGSGWEEEQDLETLSSFNRGHAERTELEVRCLLAQGVHPRDIAAITPYGAQVRLLRQLLADAVAEGLEIGTVDGFQGREKEAVVVDLVRSNSEGVLGFLNDTRRTNVALTRAKRRLVVILDGSTLSHSTYYRALIAAAEEDGAWESSFSYVATSTD